MAAKTEGAHTGEFLASEGNATQSRNTATLITGQNLPAGAVLGKITASGKYTMVAPAAGTGEQTAVAVLFDNVDATAADKVCVIIVSPAEVNDKELYWAALTGGQKTTARQQLDAAGIRVRL